MARQINRLTARTVAAITEPGRHADGGNLYLVVDKSGAKRWVFLYWLNKKLREKGLGSAGTVSLAQARDFAGAARLALKNGKDPLAAEPALPVADKPTFGAAAGDYVKAMAPGWRNPKHVDQWRTTLGINEADASKLRIDAAAEKAHRSALAALRALRVDEVETEHVLAVIAPIWKEKPETASRLRGRIEAVLAAASAKGQRRSANPAQWRNHLDRLLPKRRKLSRGHHAAMPFPDVPAFMKRLTALKSPSACALRFTILTAARSGETFGATWREFDLEQAVWTVPGARMKGGREHRVPLSVPAVAALDEMSRVGRVPDAFVFFGRNTHKPLSNMAMDMVLRRLQLDVTVHGFRSSFRDWCGETTSFPREVAEAALAHLVGDETERAYRRGDALAKRRELMEAWAAFCAGTEPAAEPPAPAVMPMPAAKKRAKTKKQEGQGEQGCFDIFL
ncbi:integrase [Bosea sp. BE125]|uniref:tyrosine-type recombinase/integrase n=1 Tax=Bosea sp. BE125 TaxID=2817909 RepID=UPI0028543EC8|nr:integrase arm-type DNA-binding domain-containing protein [Bosea sp. BE125]MDR6870127.1 integrase [Bosea sp. BE125]